MIDNKTHTLPIKIGSLSIQEIEDFIKKKPSVILPVGGYEPLGKEIMIDGINLCCEKIAEEYASQSKILMVPLIRIGYTIPFKGFSGCVGISKGSLRDVILDLCNSLIFMGVKRILIITAATYNLEPIQLAVNRINGKKRLECVKFFSLQHNEEIRSFCKSHFGVADYNRCECGILALLIYLFPDIFNKEILRIQSNITASEKEMVKRWERLGKDPNKLLKIAPYGLLSNIRDKNITREDGKLLFEYILKILKNKYSQFLIEGEYDS